MAFSLPWLCWLALLLHAHTNVISAKHEIKKSKQFSDVAANNQNKVLIINIIGDSLGQLEGALNSAVNYLQSSAICKKTKNFHCRAFIPTSLHGARTSSNLEKKVRQLRSTISEDFQVYPPSLISHNIGSSSDATTEHVSKVLFALSTVEQEFRTSTDHPVALSLSFSALSAPVFDNLHNLQNIFQKISHISSEGKKVLLFDKNKELTSPSDWHDLQVVVMALASQQSQKWLETLQDVYFYHANRTAFTLLQPRAAIMESMFAEENSVHVGLLDAADVCLHLGQPGQEVKHSSSAGGRVYAHPLCQDRLSRTASVPITCTCPPTAITPKKHKHKHKPSFTCPCSNIYSPIEWKRRVEEASPLLNERVSRRIPEFLKTLPEYNKFGTARFRFTNESDMPQGFCWETGHKEHERQSQSRIYKNSTSSVPFQHPPPGLIAPPTAKIAIISASGGEGIDKARHMSLSRTYYAHRHGYTHQHLVSEAYANYFGDNFLDKLDTMGESYPKNVMSKVPMIVSSMYAHMDMEWVLWMDDDTWFNPGWLQMSLDAYLEDVPPHKLVVLGNHRSAQSNVLFIRNTVEGRRLGRDWLSIAVSGYVQCHGFDQGALELLIMSRLYESHSNDNAGSSSSGANGFSHPAPYNFTCLQEAWAGRGDGSLSRDLYTQILGPEVPHNTTHPWGCDGGADWSCDFKFETALRNVGFIGVSSGFHMPLSSFSQGCANDYFPDFHVTSETAKRPRLHVGFCSRLDEIQGTDFCYDGPLGGGNDYVRRDAVNGWMINHKSEINFYEAYRDKEACRRSNTFIPLCNESIVESMIKDKIKKNHRLIFLADGYAYDIEAKQYCLGEASLLNFQKRETYMTAYPEVIAAAKNFSDAEWNAKQNPKIFGEYKPIRDFRKYFHPPHYCETCCTKKFSQARGGDVLSCSNRIQRKQKKPTNKS